MFDTDHWLPESARRRIESLRTKATGERAIKRALAEEQPDHAIEKQRLMGEIDRLKRWKVGRSIDPKTEHELAKVIAALAATQARIDGVNKRIAAAPQSTTAMVGRCERFV